MISAVYARQSVEKENSISIEAQIELCGRLADRELKRYVDRGYSGKNTKRPAFQSLLRDIESGLVEKVYVYRLDRFSRSVADFGRLWELLETHGVEFVSVSEHFDTSTPMGRAMLHIIMVFAQLERETTAERVKDNYYRRTELGSWPGGPAPFGYGIGTCPGENGRRIPTLQIRTEQAELVERIYREYAQDGMSLSSLARRLNSEGLPGPRRDTWDSVALSRILHNPVYVRADEAVFDYFRACGVARIPDREDFDGTRGLLLVGKRRASEEQCVSLLESPGIVSSELWLACRRKLEQNRQFGSGNRGKNSWLSGRLKCSCCGYALKISRSKGKRRLRCSGRYNLSRCSAEIDLDLEELEAAVAGEIGSLLEHAVRCRPYQELNEKQRADLKRLDRQADRLLQAFSADVGIPGVDLQRALSRIESKRKEILALEETKDRKTALPQSICFDSLSFEEKKRVSAQMIRRIEITGDRAKVIWNI